jgi:hypothetical protein
VNLKEEDDEKEEIKKKDNKKYIHKSINYFKSQTPMHNMIGKNSQLINGSIFNKKDCSNKNKSNRSINYNLESKTTKKKLIILRNKEINNPIISNGEASEYDKNESYEFIKKKLLARNKKDKKIITPDISKIKKDNQKSETAKNLRQNQMSISKKNLNSQLLKDIKNKINNNTTSGKILQAINAKTIDQLESIKAHKDRDSLNFYKPKNLYGAFTARFKKIEDFHFSRRNSSKKNSLTNSSKKESKFLNSLKVTPFNSKIRDKDNFQLPTLGNSNLASNERQNFTNYLNIYKSLNVNLNDTNKRHNIMGRRTTGASPNKIDEEITEKIFDKINPGASTKNKQSFISKLMRKQTVNLDEQKKFSKISTKLLNRNLIKYNKLLKKLRNGLKDFDKKYEIYNNKINIMNEESILCKSFIENKINKWVLNSQKDIQIFQDEEKLEFNRKENKKYLKKERKFIHIIITDFIKKISSPIRISFLYLDYHKGVIEKGILKHITEKFFDISLPKCLFDNRDLNLYINKIPKKILSKQLRRQKTIDSKKMGLLNRQESNNNSIKIFEKNNKVSRRLSTIIREKRESKINNYIYHDEIEKKSLIYCYLDINLYDEEEAKKNDNNDSFLELLKSNSLNNDSQNKCKSVDPKSKHSLFSKKSSIKNSNNLSMNKAIDIFKTDRKSFFRNNFFDRNEIKNLNVKVQNTSSKKKSVLEYNLLFDPSLTGYNNLIYDPEVTKDPNKIKDTNRNVITKSDLKEIQKLKNKQLTSFLNSSGGMKTDKNIYVMKTLDLKNQYNHKNKGNINSLISSIKDCNFDSFVKFYRTCNCGPNAIDKDGNSLLSLSVRSSCPEIVSFLLDEKANPNLQNVIIYNF